MKVMILPEFNSNDERKAEITGKAVKDAFSALLIFTPIVLVALGLVLILTYDGKFRLMMTLLIASSIPIAGLIA